jgi:hypothetical protein
LVYLFMLRRNSTLGLRPPWCHCGPALGNPEVSVQDGSTRQASIRPGSLPTASRMILG